MSQYENGDLGLELHILTPSKEALIPMVALLTSSNHSATSVSTSWHGERWHALINVHELATCSLKGVS